MPLMTIAGGVLGLAIAAGGGPDRTFEAGAGTMMALFGTGALVIELRGVRRR